MTKTQSVLPDVGCGPGDDVDGQRKCKRADNGAGASFWLNDSVERRKLVGRQIG